MKQVEEDKLKDKEGFKNRRAKISGNEFRQQKSSMKQSVIQQKHKEPAPPFASALAPKIKGEYNTQNSQCFRVKPSYSQNIMAKRGSKLL